MERFDGHGGMYGVWADVITFSRCDTPQGGVKEVRNVFGWRGVMVMGGCTGVWEGVIFFRRCDTPQGGVKDVRKVCQMMERCDGHWGM